MLSMSPPAASDAVAPDDNARLPTVRIVVRSLSEPYPSPEEAERPRRALLPRGASPVSAEETASSSDDSEEDSDEDEDGAAGLWGLGDVDLDELAEAWSITSSTTEEGDYDRYLRDSGRYLRDSDRYLRDSDDEEEEFDGAAFLGLEFAEMMAIGLRGRYAPPPAWTSSAGGRSVASSPMSPPPRTRTVSENSTAGEGEEADPPPATATAAAEAADVISTEVASNDAGRGRGDSEGSSGGGGGGGRGSPAAASDALLGVDRVETGKIGGMRTVQIPPPRNQSRRRRSFAGTVA